MSFCVELSFFFFFFFLAIIACLLERCTALDLIHQRFPYDSWIRLQMEKIVRLEFDCATCPETIKEGKSFCVNFVNRTEK